MVTRRTVIKSSVAVPLAGSALLASILPGSVAAQDLTVIVGSKDFTEQFILGNMYIKILEDMGIATEDSTNLGGTQIAHQALESGDIHLYPEYTGTGLTEVLGLSVEDVLGGGATPVAVAEATPASTDASQAVYDAVKAAYAEQFGLVWLERSPANNTQALAVKRAFSEENGITTISQLAEMAGDLIVSAPADFPEREDGLLGLQRVYGAGFEEIEVLPVAPGLKYQALEDDQAQVVLAFGTDGQIAGLDLVVLEDDLSLWPPYNIAPVVRQEVLDAYPDVEARFNEVTTSLTDEILSDLNWRVDGDAKEEPADVAESYLTENGFIGG
ncbi:MAG: quaternary ammonium transporter [Chloroflexota bacterium]|nr:quaternary ammonium transporter [Chloroflexota bacterium]